MGRTKVDETYIFKISIKMRFFWCSNWYQNSIFLEFWLLLSRVATYYISLPRTVWFFYHGEMELNLNIHCLVPWCYVKNITNLVFQSYITGQSILTAVYALWLMSRRKMKEPPFLWLLLSRLTQSSLNYLKMSFTRNFG